MFTCRTVADHQLVGVIAQVLRMSSVAPSHAIAFASGFLICWLLGSSPKHECPACVVTCGSLSCPAVSCTTGSIQGGSALGLIAVSLLAFGVFVCWRVWKLWIIDCSERPAKVVVDGRRGALGAASSWRPITG